MTEFRISKSTFIPEKNSVDFSIIDENIINYRVYRHLQT